MLEHLISHITSDSESEILISLDVKKERNLIRVTSCRRDDCAQQVHFVNSKLHLYHECTISDLEFRISNSSSPEKMDRENLPNMVFKVFIWWWLLKKISLDDETWIYGWHKCLFSFCQILLLYGGLTVAIQKWIFNIWIFDHGFLISFSTSLIGCWMD